MIEKFSHIHDWNTNTLNLNISILHLGKKTKYLKISGYKTINDIVKCNKLDIRKIDNIGLEFIKKIQFSLDSLNRSQKISGEINWDVYCNLLKIPLLPLKFTDTDGYSFVETIETTFKQMNDIIEDPALNKILSDRLNRMPKERSTLEQIASSLLRPVTRERIRQKEAKFLKSIAAAFFDDNYSEINIHFRPEFTFFWRQAAEFFASSDEEISIDTLMDGLVKTWQIDKKKLIDNIPIIVSIITGEVMPANFFGESICVNPKLIGLPLDIKSIPLKKLQIGRFPYLLSRHGIETIGDLISTLNRSERYHNSMVYKGTVKHLDLLSNAIDDNNYLDWPKYIELTGVSIVPEINADNPKDFFKYLSLNISELLRISYDRKYSRENYTLRISRPLKTRITSLKLAKFLNTHAPTLSLVEKETLIYLNRVILQADHSFAGVEISKDFSQMWVKMGEVFDISEGDSELLQKNLAEEFKLKDIDLVSAMPTIFAIFTGQSLGRLTRSNRLSVNEVIKESDEPIHLDSIKSLTMRVKLKGFKRLH